MNRFIDEREKSVALNDLIEIVKIPTVSATGSLSESSFSYNKCSQWLLHRLSLIDCLTNVHIINESVENKPIVVATWHGVDSSLSSILLNSHYDVVPVIDEYWTVPPFAGYQNGGRVYGRGVQDMKSVCVQYINSITYLNKVNYKPLRTIHLSFVPDEEIGGNDGMGVLMQSQWYKGITIGLALDEGLASEDSNYSIFYGERLPWWIKVKAEGNTGHASRFIEDTAVEKILKISEKALSYRLEQKKLLDNSNLDDDIVDSAITTTTTTATASVVGTDVCNHCAYATRKKLKLGDVTTINLTSLHSGVTAGGKDVLNVIPPTAEASFDIRISPHTQPITIKNMFDSWCHEISTPATTTTSAPTTDMTWSFVVPALQEHSTTSIDPSINHWWSIMQSTLQDCCGITILPEVFPAATDSRYLRAHKKKAFGFR